MDDQTTQYLPFNAINQFMRDDYRSIVIRRTLNGLSSLSAGDREPVDRMTRKYVQVPGFRISTKAPVTLRLKPTIDAFEKNSEMAAAILSAWAEMHKELRDQVYALLVTRKWQVLPPEADRTKYPGFVPHWPEDEIFDRLSDAFKETYPAIDNSDDDINLMIVWVSVRLPYQSSL
jgi:hypothetical protein